jgi:protein O-mannosyl-transferase
MDELIAPPKSPISDQRGLGGGWLPGRFGELIKDREWPAWSMGCFIALAVFLAYSNTFHGPFQYDDVNDVLENSAIRHLWPLRDIFVAPGGAFLTRPTANFTFALNYASGGMNPFHYHITNFVIHLCASWTLFGVVRRTLSLPAIKVGFEGGIGTLSLITTAYWALHPLLTESVSYITQRYESLMGLFVLLTFYCTLRLAESPSSDRWVLLASVSCALALGSKEVAVSLPILVLLFDRAFIAGSFREAWSARRKLYFGLLLVWLGFLYLQLHAVHRTWAGYNTDTIPWWRYALNQPAVVLHYLRLAVWPHPLNFDYLWPAANRWSQLVPGLVVIGILVAITVWALVRNYRSAFLSVFFLFILAPTSSVMPILDLAVEHRMYLPLVPVVVSIIFLGHYLINRFNLSIANNKYRRIIAIFVIAGSISTLGIATYLRNLEYQSTIDLWRDVVEKAPKNPRAHHNYAFFLAQSGYFTEALRQYAISVEQSPGTALFHGNYGVLLGRLGFQSEAQQQQELALGLEPKNPKHYINLGGVFLARGERDGAIRCFLEAIELNPNSALAHSALAEGLLAKREFVAARALAQKAVVLDPTNPEFRFKLGSLRLVMGDLPGANSAFLSAKEHSEHPDLMVSDIGWAFHKQGLDRDAVTNLRSALRLTPNHVRSQIRLGWILATSSDGALRNGQEAQFLAKSLLSSRSDRPPELLDLLAVSLAEQGRFPEAQTMLQEALAQSSEKKEDWVSVLEKRLELFKKNQPYRELPKSSDRAHQAEPSISA